MNYLAIKQKHKIRRILRSKRTEEEKIEEIAYLMSDIIRQMSNNIHRARVGLNELPYENRNRSKIRF